MRLNYLIILLILLAIVLGFSYYYSLMPAEVLGEEISGKEQQKEERFVIREETQEVTEELEQEGEKDSIIISDEMPKTKEEKVEILFNIFSPKTLTIKKGTKVTWVNRDNKVHQIKELSTDHLFRSNRINPDDSFSFTFTKAGEYRYMDTISTYMSGKIIVQESALETITGNVVSLSKNPADLTTLVLFILIGISLIYGKSIYKRRTDS